MEAALRTVKLAPRPLAHFTYRGEAVTVQLLEDDSTCIQCPVCSQTCRIPDTHTVITNLGAPKLVSTIYPSVSCVNSQCGFRIVVVRGQACEVEQNGTPHAPEPEAPLKQGQRRCRECRRAFNPGLHAGGKTTTGRWGRGRWSEDDDAPSICQRCSGGGRKAKWKRG